MTRKAIHVTPRQGGWAVTREGSKRASSIHPTQKQAETAGRAAARKGRTEFVLHGRNGQIRAKDSYGHDPNPPKG
jgi:uncharacterized protein DUF2188